MKKELFHHYQVIGNSLLIMMNRFQRRESKNQWIFIKVMKFTFLLCKNSILPSKKVSFKNFFKELGY